MKERRKRPLGDGSNSIKQGDVSASANSFFVFNTDCSISKKLPEVAAGKPEDSSYSKTYASGKKKGTVRAMKKSKGGMLVEGNLKATKGRGSGRNLRIYLYEQWD